MVAVAVGKAATLATTTRRHIMALTITGAATTARLATGLAIHQQGAAPNLVPPAVMG